MTICAGSRFGRYEILHELGRGAMGVVYQARDPQIDRLVALKTISLDTQDPDDEAAFRSRFFQEAKAAGRLSHPGIVQVFDVGEEPSTRLPYLVMELVPGRSLNQYIHSSGGKLPLEIALAVTEQVAEALAHAHSLGVVHRDIKPSNILITEETRAKITDFGVARLDKTAMTLPGEVFGTPSYMAPEQVTGGPVDGRADLFALGVILYLMLSGHKPFQGLSNRTIRHNVVHHAPVPVSALDLDISPQLAAVVRRAIEKDPAKRYQTGTEMALAIQRLHDLSSSRAGHAIAANDERDSTACGSSMFPLPLDLANTLTALTQPSVRSDSSGSVTVLSSPQPLPLNEPRRADLVLARPQPRTVPLAMRNRFRGHNLLLAALAVSTLVLAGYTAIDRMHVLSATSRSPEAGNDSAQINSSTLVTTRQEATQTPARNRGPEKRTEVPAKQMGKQAQKRPANPREIAAESKPLKIAAQSKAASAAAAKPIPQSGTALSLDINHPFDQAQVHVWIDNALAFTDTLRGDQKKRFGLFNRTEGKQSTRLNVSAGEHRIRVRVQASGYDESRLVAHTFALNRNDTLHIKCDKRNNDLHLRFD